MKFLKYAWHILAGLAYLVIVVGIVSAASTRFETMVLAGMVQLYGASSRLFVLGILAEVNNHAAFIRFKILAGAQGIAANEDGTFEEQADALADSIKSYTPKVWIHRLSRTKHPSEIANSP